MSAGPTFIVAGVGRGGTTGLVEGLRSSDSVFITTPKEPHYLAFHGARPAFRGPGDELLNAAAVTDESDYQALYADGASQAARGEGSVSTMHYAERALPEIARLNPEMKAVIVLREPVDRAFSSWQYLRGLDLEPMESFPDAVQEEDKRIAASWQHLWHYTRMSLYADRLEAFFSALGRDQVLVVFHDDLTADFDTTLRSVLTFLGVETAADRAFEATRVNVSGQPRSATGQRMLMAASRNHLLRWSATHVTTFRARERLRGLLLRQRTVDADVRSSLSPVFADDLSRVADLLSDQRLPDWLHATSTPS